MTTTTAASTLRYHYRINMRTAFPLMLLLLGFTSLIATRAVLAVSTTNDIHNLRSRVIKAKAVMSKGNISDYPNYCWFDGLENRILLEYPKLNQLIRLHYKRLHNEKDYSRAAELHKEIFMRIYQIELDKLSSEGGAKINNEKPQQWPVSNPEHKAAYKLYDLWANTPGNFEREQGDFANYLQPYLIQSHIEFWDYCLENREGCNEVLGQLSILSREQELGPIELLQVSLNIIMLMNSHKADLVLERLVSRHVIKVEGEDDSDRSGNRTQASQSAIMEMDESDYEMLLAKVVKLIETDDDFNEAAFQYVYTNTPEVHKIIDSDIESYLADRIEA